METKEHIVTDAEGAAGRPFNTVHVIGLGAIGTVVATCLAKAGLAVHTYGGGHGSHRSLQTSYSDRVDQTDVFSHRCALPNVRTGDAVLIAVKWPHLLAVLEAIKPRLNCTNFLLCPQNGLVDRELAGLPNSGNIIPVVAHVAAECVTRGSIVVHTVPRLLVPNYSCFPSPRALENEGFTFMNEHDFSIAQRVKLLVACTSAKMALVGASIGEAFSDSCLRKELLAIAAEAAQVLILDAPGDRRLREEANRVLDLISSGNLVEATAMKSAYTSMHGDLNVRHQKTETSWLNGLIVRMGNVLGLRTSVNAAILASINERERRRPTVCDNRGGSV
jgi:ketopantoate reductase